MRLLQHDIATDHTANKSMSFRRYSLQAWPGPQGSRRFRPPDFLTIGTWRC